MTARSTALALTLVLSSLSISACRRKVEPVTAPVPTTTTTSTSTADDAARRRADSLAADAQRRADSVAAANRAAAMSSADAQRAQAEMVNVLQQRVYFDYDQDNLREDAAAVLDAKAAILLANPAVTVAITGHTDERGTAEYNLALGQRRAAQVKRYLASKGVAEARLATQSLGDSQPAAPGTDEASYQQNRRAEFEVANVSRALVRPQP
jgi:peptidoglycan-associated lipoprotein